MEQQKHYYLVFKEDYDDGYPFGTFLYLENAIKHAEECVKEMNENNKMMKEHQQEAGFVVNDYEPLVKVTPKYGALYEWQGSNEFQGVTIRKRLFSDFDYTNDETV